MGEVYRAHDPRLGRDVAIKILPPHRDFDPDAVARFTREARAVAALSHPGILTIHDIGQEDGHLFLVTELLEGETLRRRLSRGPLPWRQALDIASAVASGLAAAHVRGIVHRDLKPENIFITSSGTAKILDFGVAKLVDPQLTGTRTSPAVGLTAPGAAVGTLAYMAPEQLEGRDVDHRADQFAFGILLHELVGGHHPFRRRHRARDRRGDPARHAGDRSPRPGPTRRPPSRGWWRAAWPATRPIATRRPPTWCWRWTTCARTPTATPALRPSLRRRPNGVGGWWLAGAVAAAALVAAVVWGVQGRARRGAGHAPAAVAGADRGACCPSAPSAMASAISPTASPKRSPASWAR